MNLTADLQDQRVADAFKNGSSRVHSAVVSTPNIIRKVLQRKKLILDI